MHDKDFKATIIETSSDVGLKEAALAGGITRRTLTRWRKEAEQAGDAVRPLPTGRSRYTEEERERILTQARKARTNEVASKEGVPRATVYRWLQEEQGKDTWVCADWRKIRQMEKALGIRIDEFLDISQATRYRWESAGRMPRKKLLIAADVLGLSLGALSK